ncbi:hypothetical protein WICPIJ_008522 [Wickerhamomyces pijperi]|uniref:Uncharacterized protein n=1 Tax=Wickerhamomyces pijperi TaxID=599730 RepID=A0A9P8THI7_WICPI|nr:hypothetical protein WICPIJ_008522 [Wickerhamomyces pijperi]
MMSSLINPLSFYKVSLFIISPSLYASGISAENIKPVSSMPNTDPTIYLLKQCGFASNKLTIQPIKGNDTDNDELTTPDTFNYKVHVYRPLHFFQSFHDGHVKDGDSQLQVPKAYIDKVHKTETFEMRYEDGVYQDQDLTGLIYHDPVTKDLDNYWANREALKKQGVDKFVEKFESFDINREMTFDVEEGYYCMMINITSDNQNITSVETPSVLPVTLNFVTINDGDQDFQVFFTWHFLPVTLLFTVLGVMSLVSGYWLNCNRDMRQFFYALGAIVLGYIAQSYLGTLWQYFGYKALELNEAGQKAESHYYYGLTFWFVLSTAIMEIINQTMIRFLYDTKSRILFTKSSYFNFKNALTLFFYGNLLVFTLPKMVSSDSGSKDTIGPIMKSILLSCRTTYFGSLDTPSEVFKSLEFKCIFTKIAIVLDFFLFSDMFQRFVDITRRVDRDTRSKSFQWAFFNVFFICGFVYFNVSIMVHERAVSKSDVMLKDVDGGYYDTLSGGPMIDYIHLPYVFLMIWVCVMINLVIINRKTFRF